MNNMLSEVAQVTPLKIKRSLLQPPLDHLITLLFLAISDLEEYTFETPQGKLTITLPVNSAFTGVARRGEQYELNLIDAITKSDIEDRGFFDVGARFGYSSLAAKLCGIDETDIHTFEASYLYFKIIHKNLQQSNLRNRFVGDGSSGTLSLDDYVEGHRVSPGGIKIDVEGAE